MKFGQVDNLDSVDFNYSEIPLKTKENLSSIKRNNKIHFFFGAPGWSDVNFKGSIYPLKTSSKKMLLNMLGNLIVLNLMVQDMVCLNIRWLKIGKKR